MAVADVYAGDALGPPSGENGADIFSFSIEIDPDPDGLIRVAMVFNLANRAPLSFDYRREGEGPAAVTVAILLANYIQADLLRRKLAQLTCTRSVALVGRLAF